MKREVVLLDFVGIAVLDATEREEIYLLYRSAPALLLVQATQNRDNIPLIRISMRISRSVAPFT